MVELIFAFDNLDEAFEILEVKLRSSGIEKIMAEMQKQTADFLMNKYQKICFHLPVAAVL